MVRVQPDYELRSIYFYLTKVCNLKCRHCWIAPEFSNKPDLGEFLSYVTFDSVIEQAIPLGLREVKLTGGEPLLHPEFLRILQSVKKHGLGLHIETNGVLCTEEVACAIREASSKVSISVSMDGADAKSHEWIRGVSGSFDAALEGIGNLISAGLKPQLIFSLAKSNMNQIEPFIKLAEKLGAGSVKFNPIQPTGRGNELHQCLETLSIGELIEVGNWIENEIATKVKVRVFFTQPLAFHSLSRMFSCHGNGCQVCGILEIIGVLADGSYSLCGIGERVPELIFGNALQDSISTVWSKSTVLNEIREGMPHELEGICGICLMKALCKGSCLAQNYYRSQSLWGPFWFCEEAYAKGLFPTSRHINEVELDPMEAMQ